VVAPRYAKDPLKHAEEEVGIVLARIPGERIDPSSFLGLNDKLKTAKASLLHFACHGVDRMEDDDGERLLDVQALQLEGTNQVLDSRSVRGLPAFRTFFRQRPLVMLNACEVGRPAPALNGIGGLASSFIDLGAAGVIAPLWSVDDEVAFKVAQAVYLALAAKPAPTFAEVMRSVRTRAYVGDEMGTDSYAAYCFYGDPLARPG
jgi:CHAT domain-containing protein